MTITALAGVYDADGGVRGEVTYVIGHLLGRTHCALCDITHSPVRRKPAWDAMVERLGVPVTLLHRNELAGDLVAAAQGVPLAAVFALDDGTWRVFMGPGELDALGGSVEAFESVAMAKLHA
jgi:hypothetical protein